MKNKIILLFLFVLFVCSVNAQKYKNGTRLLKGAEVLSNTPLQLDYVLENLSDTANIKNLHEGKTHLVLDDKSGECREWWFIGNKWKVKNAVNETHIPGDDFSLLMLKDNKPVTVPFLNVYRSNNYLKISDKEIANRFHFILTGNNVQVTNSYNSNLNSISLGNEGVVLTTNNRSKIQVNSNNINVTTQYLKCNTDNVNTTSHYIGKTIMVNDVRSKSDHSPGKKQIKFERETNNPVYPYSEFVFSKDNFEIISGNYKKSINNYIPQDTIFRVGENFNFRNLIRYDTNEKVLRLQNRIDFLNEGTASGTIGNCNDDLYFSSKTLKTQYNIDTLSLTDIYKHSTVQAEPNQILYHKEHHIAGIPYTQVAYDSLRGLTINYPKTSYTSHIDISYKKWVKFYQGLKGFDFEVSNPDFQPDNLYDKYAKLLITTDRFSWILGNRLKDNPNSSASPDAFFHLTGEYLQFSNMTDITADYSRFTKQIRIAPQIAFTARNYITITNNNGELEFQDEKATAKLSELLRGTIVKQTTEPIPPDNNFCFWIDNNNKVWVLLNYNGTTYKTQLNTL